MSASTLASAATSTWSSVRPSAKRSWHASIDVSARRSVLLHILMLLKAKYGKVDAKISYIGRRAELALYSQAFSAWEYRNPQTLSRRLHSLVVKLHLNNLAVMEESAFAMEQAQIFQVAASRKRKCSAVDESVAGKRARCESVEVAVVPTTSPLFFDGNRDLLQHVCSFLAAPDVLQCAATCTQAASQLPALVTSIEVSTVALSRLAPTVRASFFARFPNLEKFALTGRMQAQQFNFQDEKTLVSRNVLVRSVLSALNNANLSKLEVFSLNFCYSEGLKDHVTSQVANVLAGPCSNFPRLHTLSLVGNCISDDGVMDLYDAIALPRDTMAGNSRLALLDLSQNFIGERGHVQLQELVTQFGSRGSALVVNVMNNLLTVGVAAESFQ
ncbi:Leucine-rich repeat, ribonuclease inhibitor subtype [Phytophthora cinnamomi]|uniref:Leucine-rich repeat, ribonuclease inhibitor subtype n=1 Tax=Phytophthora cinnamomi TaxID=4785 RepID=UPI003559909C|nr:Leucine-rich repeat, ribonuclease inhibitor subtype [Phytophthora cinnamomi]